jgi:glycosyltransferase involved in cell wall biosynthesis
LVKQQKYIHFVLAEKDYNAFLNAGATNLYRIKNGINSSEFKFSKKPLFDKSIYLGKITRRKNQAKYQKLSNIDFVGGCDDINFDKTNPNYLGEWTRKKIHEELTSYGNLVLLSDGEADPLVVKEALVAGLGVVVNQSSAENLDTSKDFITIIEDNKMEDFEFIDKKIKENREISIKKRSNIRKYGISMFDIRNEVEKYVNIIN